jgi:hypothetical protein
MQLISWFTFKSGLFGFICDLFCTFCTSSHPTYGNQTGPNETLGSLHPNTVGSPVPTVKKKPTGIPVKPAGSLRFQKLSHSLG